MAGDGEINEWLDAITTLHTSVATDRSNERLARDATANLLSGFGYQDAPRAVLDIVTHAIEIGYMTALRDVQDGMYDTELSEWRDLDSLRSS